jgi:membrane protein implicated in regulation of membrane protease activity
MELLLTLGSWTWFIVGALLLAIELTVPGTFMLWLGLAALAVGAISRAVDWSWQWQLVAFILISIALVPVWRRVALRSDAANAHPTLNRRTEGFIGRVFTLEKPIADGAGVVRIGDTVWRVAGPDCPAGSRVQVTSADGPDLRVEPVDEPPPAA